MAESAWEALLRFLSSTQAGARGSLASLALNPLGVPGGPDIDPNDPQALGFHRQTSQHGTERLGSVLDPRVAQVIMDALGYANEAASGGLQALGGKPFYSEVGFDWDDILANRQGQEAGVANLLAERTPPEINPYNARFGGPATDPSSLLTFRSGGPATDSRSLLGILLESIYRSPNGVR
jgi:hypothetical protein